MLFRSNRLNKNLWKRTYFVDNLEKRLNLFNIKLFKVNPMYTSIVGNCQHTYTDPINASLEIARRGYNVIILKNKQFYPNFFIKNSLNDLWKKQLGETFTEWKELFKQVKNSKLRYRVSLGETDKSYRVFQMNSRKSGVLIYKFI